MPTARGSEPLHPSTVKHAFIAANKVFRYAIRHRLITHNPATRTELPRVQHDATLAPQFLSGAEAEALVSALAGWTPDDVFVLVAAYCGLRSGEIQALRVGDVDVQRSRIKVQRTLVETKDGWREDSPKSANSTRVVPMNARVVSALSAYLADHPQRRDPSARLWLGRKYAGSGEWRGGLDWDKRMAYESFYRRRRWHRSPDPSVPRSTPHRRQPVGRVGYAARDGRRNARARRHERHLQDLPALLPRPVVALHGGYGRVPRSARRRGRSPAPDWVQLTPRGTTMCSCPTTRSC